MIRKIDEYTVDFTDDGMELINEDGSRTKIKSSNLIEFFSENEPVSVTCAPDYLQISTPTMYVKIKDL